MTPKRATKPFQPRSFDERKARARALWLLCKPPDRAEIVRPVPVGTLVHSWVLPLDLCPGLNLLAEMPKWMRGSIKKRALKLMLEQCLLRRAAKPLPGRPFVRVLRCSSTAADKDAGFSKIPVDRLCVGKPKRPKGMAKPAWERLRKLLPPTELGYLVDDRPSAVDLHTWWEPAPPGEGFVWVELWTGAPSGDSAGEAK